MSCEVVRAMLFGLCVVVSFSCGCVVPIAILGGVVFLVFGYACLLIVCCVCCVSLCGSHLMLSLFDMLCIVCHGCVWIVGACCVLLFVPFGGVWMCVDVYMVISVSVSEVFCVLCVDCECVLCVVWYKMRIMCGVCVCCVCCCCCC